MNLIKIILGYLSLINKLDGSDIKDDLKMKYKKLGDNFRDEDLILIIDIVNKCLINYQKVKFNGIFNLDFIKLRSLSLI